MGTWNFGNDYYTDYSYQLMDNSAKSATEIAISIEEDIAKLGTLNLTFDGQVEFIFELEEVSITSGYYEGYRLMPEFTIEANDLTEDDSFETDYYPYLLSEMKGKNYNEQVTETVEISMSENQLQEVQEYFDKVNKIMSNHLTPYCVGWTASPIVKEKQ